MVDQGLELVDVTYDKMPAFMDGAEEGLPVASAKLLGLVK